MSIFDLNIMPDKSTISILVVDDDPVVLGVLTSYLNSFGYRVTAAKDGLDALAALEKDEFAIVLTDMNMPKMNGMELLQYCRKHYPQSGVIVITGLSETYSYIDVINAGAIDYLTKPFDGQELEAKLNRVVREQTLISKLETISICDQLTGIYNRRFFEIKMKEEVRRASRQGYQVFLALLDVDGFKEYNDGFGHPAGDQVLIEIGRIMTSCARENVDWNFRYGGDEFAIIITQTTLEQAIHVNERIMNHFLEKEFGDTSLSSGLAKFIRRPDNTWDADIRDLVERADQALYLAKQSGKNKVIYDGEAEGKADATAPTAPAAG